MGGFSGAKYRPRIERESSVTTRAPSFPYLPVAYLVRKLCAEVEREEEDGRALGPRVHDAVGVDVALRHAAQQEVQVGDHGQDEHQGGARRVEPPAGARGEVGALFGVTLKLSRIYRGTHPRALARSKQN